MKPKVGNSWVNRVVLVLRQYDEVREKGKGFADE